MLSCKKFDDLKFDSEINIVWLKIV